MFVLKFILILIPQNKSLDNNALIRYHETMQNDITKNNAN